MSERSPSASNSRYTCPESIQEDHRLVKKCLEGDEAAWASLIEKYKQLIYFIPMKYGCTPADAADIFQAVCLDLFSELHRVRKVDSLRSWLMTVTAHRALQWKQKNERQTDRTPVPLDDEIAAESVTLIDRSGDDLDRDQAVREAIHLLPERCKELVRLLFYEHPPIPYEEVASRLGLATGSIGFIRGRCLRRLEKTLREMGF